MQTEMLDSVVSSNSQELSARIVCVLGVRGYEEDGVAYLHIEDSARGLGFEKTESKNGIEYKSIRWAVVDGYLSDLGFRQKAVENGNPHDYYIPENIFYRLCMKAKNEVAEKFQAKVADEIIPSIRKTGSYSVAQNQPVMLPNFCNPAEAARAWADLYEKNQATEKRAITAESERDEAIRTKAMIGSRREATAMNTASQKSKECKRLTAENDLLTSENSRLRQDYVENKDFCKQLLAQKLVVYVEKTLRDKCSKALQELSNLMEIRRLEWKEFSESAGREVPRYAYHKDVCAELKQRIIDNPKYLRRFK